MLNPIENRAYAPEATWSIAEAVLVGVGGFIFAMLLLFCATFLVNTHKGYFIRFTAYQISIGTTLVSLLGAGFVVGCVIALRHRSSLCGGRWREALEWNGGVHTVRSIAYGAVLAVAFSITMTRVYGTAGYFDRSLLFSLGLYIITVVIIEAAVEELYFRGILFLALARTTGRLSSIIIVTLIFALMHPGHRLYVLPIAAALGVVRLKTNSLASCFALHASYNLCLALYQVAFTR